jgi:hydroxyacylglutathione hydrolase
LAAENEDQARTAVRDLAMIGLDEVSGWIPGSDLRDTVPFKPARWDELKAWQGSVLDVRWPDEYAEGHVDGAINVPLAFLADRAGEVPNGPKLAIYCGTGSRSRIALGVLAAKGFREVCNVEGSYDEYMGMGGSVEACCTPR